MRIDFAYFFSSSLPRCKKESSKKKTPTKINEKIKKDEKTWDECSLSGVVAVEGVRSSSRVDAKDGNV